MALTYFGSGSTGDTGSGGSSSSQTPTAAALPTGSGRFAVLRIANASGNAETFTITLGGQSPTATYDSAPTDWWKARTIVCTWDSTAIDAMSGTTLSMTTGSATCWGWTLDYYEGVGSVRGHSYVNNDTFDPSVTTVADDWVLSVSTGRYATSATYAGTGTERQNVGELIASSFPTCSMADKVATGTTTTDDYTLAGSPAGGWGALVIVPASSGVAVSVGVKSVQVTKYSPTVGVNHAVSVGVKSVQITKYNPTVTVGSAVAVSVGVKSVQVTKYNPTITVGSAVVVSVGVKSVQVTKYNPTIAVVGPSSAALTVNASTVNVRENGHAVRYESLADHPVRNYRGTCISAITTARGYRRIWSMQTPPMTTAVAACFEADISTGDLFTVTGFLVGSSTLTAAIANIQRDDEPLFASFSFDLIESL